MVFKNMKFNGLILVCLIGIINGISPYVLNVSGETYDLGTGYDLKYIETGYGSFSYSCTADSIIDILYSGYISLIGNDDVYGLLRIKRGSTTLVSHTHYFNFGSVAMSDHIVSIHYIDKPGVAATYTYSYELGTPGLLGSFYGTMKVYEPTTGAAGEFGTFDPLILVITILLTLNLVYTFFKRKKSIELV